MTVNEAVLALRKSRRETLQQFAHTAGLSITAVCNYQRDRMPEPEKLQKLLNIAEDSRQPDLAEIFRDALQKELQVFSNWEGIMSAEPRDDFERLLVHATLAIVRSEILADQRPELIRVLELACAGVGSRIDKAQHRPHNQKHLRRIQAMIRALTRFKAATGQNARWDEKKMDVVMIPVSGIGHLRKGGVR